MKKTSKENIRLGFLVILGTVFLVTAAYLIGNNRSMFSKTFTISSVFENVNGLQQGNNVRFSGIKVGSVSSIDMDTDTTIRIQMQIENKMMNYIKKDAIAAIGSDGLVGNMIVNIIPGKGNKIPIEDDDEIVGFSRIETDDILSTLSVTNENIAILSSDLLKITSSIKQGKGTLGMLINDTILAVNLQKTISNLKNASSEAATTIKEINSIIKSIKFEESVAGKLLSDSISGQKIETIIAHLETSSKEIETTAINLNRVVDGISNGEGVINYLSKDTVFVNNLDNTIKNIEQGTDKFNENMEALKHNFLFRGYFKKLERQQKRANEKLENEKLENEKLENEK